MKFQVTIPGYNGKSVRIGEVIGDTFFKEVEKSKHLFRKLDAWGIDAQRFTDVISRCKKIVIYDKENFIEYHITVEEFEKKKEFLHFKPHRAQVFVPRRYFHTVTKAK